MNQPALYFQLYAYSLYMPDHIAPSDDDETIEPHFNDTGDFGEQDQGDEDDDDE